MEDKRDKDQVFTDLAPISRNIKSSIYQKAFDFCIGKKEINNIALTGPYGSGKSSIIRGLIDQKNLQEENSILEISLASFESEYSKPEGPSKGIDDKQIELSILQQMIYSSSASQLPKSRFKRIRTPKNSTLIALSSVAWVIGFILIFGFWKEIFSLELWKLPFFIAGGVVFSFLVTSYKLIKTTYETVYGSSFKKISVKNMEVEKGDEENSVLNKYLDEILYFFEMTNYKLVVFEDIDRFDSPNIFIKLREINTLINQNEDIKSKHHVQFLYAIKDSIFTENERTKFFEFIIPVIPVIGFSNSSDLLVTRIKSIPDLNEKIDIRFVQDVSEFLNDARLVNNIFNEFIIYLQEVNDPELNVTSLLAMMVYKNVYGKDFENLHHSQGVFFSILSAQKSLAFSRKKVIEEETVDLKNELSNAKLERANSEKELISAYIGCLAKQYSKPLVGLRLQPNSELVSLSDINSFRDIEPFISQTNMIFAQNASNYDNSNISFKQIEDEIDPNNSIQERIRNIKNKSIKQQQSLRKKIQAFEAKLTKADGLALNELLKDQPSLIDSCIETDDSEFSSNLRLFRFLLFSGNLNEHYQLYTAIFRENDGWSKLDRKFYIAVKSREVSPYDVLIDNPSEICRRLQIHDFDEKYILNIILFDYLLSHQNTTSTYLAQSLEFLSQNYETEYVQSFIANYLTLSNNLPLFFKNLISHWPTYVDSCLFSNNRNLEIAKLMDNADVFTITTLNESDALKEHIENFLSNIYTDELISSPSQESFKLLKSLNVKVANLKSIESNGDLLTFLTENVLYEINLANIKYLLTLLNFDYFEINSQTLNVIYSNKDKNLSNLVINNLETFIEKVMLLNPENTKEPIEIVDSLINTVDLPFELRKKIIIHQDCVFHTFEGINISFWNTLIQTNKIQPTWQNIFQYFNITESKGNEFLDTYLNIEKNADTLELEMFALEGDKDEILKFKQYLYDNIAIHDVSYIKLHRGINTRWNNFPKDISSEKKLLLASNNFVVLSKESIERPDINWRIVSALIQSNYGLFVRDVESYKDHMSFELALELYQSDLPENFKIQLSRIVNDTILAYDNEIADIAAPFFIKLGLNVIEQDVAATLIYFVKNVELGIKLFKAYLDKFGLDESLEIFTQKIEEWDEKSVIDMIKLLPSPLCDISVYGKNPTIPFSERNLKFVSALEENKVISSKAVSKDKIRIHTKRKP